MTGEDGMVVFEDVMNGYDIAYTIQADGYKDINKSLNVEGEYVELNFSMSQASGLANEALENISPWHGQFYYPV